jgi:hypothetical protein
MEGGDEITAASFYLERDSATIQIEGVRGRVHQSPPTFTRRSHSSPSSTSPLVERKEPGMAGATFGPGSDREYERERVARVSQTTSTPAEYWTRAGPVRGPVTRQEVDTLAASA